MSHFAVAAFSLWIALAWGGIQSRSRAEVSTAATGEGQFVAAVSDPVVSVAQPFELHLTLTAPAGTQASFPTYESELSSFEILASKDMFDVPTDIGRTWIRRLTLESLETGTFEIPGLPVTITRNGITSTLTTEPIVIEVASVLESRVDPTQFRDIAPVVDVEPPPARLRQWQGWAIAAVLGIGGILGTGLAIARRRSITPGRWAACELDRLSRQRSGDANDPILLLQQLTAVLREYLHLQFDIPTTHTTEEAMQVLRTRRLLADKCLAKLECLLSTSDASKFAGVSLTEEQVQDAIADARQIVDAAGFDRKSGTAPRLASEGTC